MSPIVVGEAGTVGDTLRLVRFVAPDFESGTPVLLAEITNEFRKIAEGGSPQLAPGEHETGNIVLDAPYAGEVQTLDRHHNSRLSFVLRTFAADAVADADWIAAAIENAPPRSAIEWRRGASLTPTYFPLRGDVDWTPTYAMRETMQGVGMTIGFGVEVARWAHRGEKAPQSFASLALPAVLSLPLPIGGDLPALTDVEIIPSGGGAYPVFALLGWWRRATAPAAAVAPFGMLGGGSTWRVDTATVEPDDETSLTVEVFASMTGTQTLVLSTLPVGGTGFGARRYSEYGAAGVTVRSFGRLGRLVLSPNAVQDIQVTGGTVTQLYVVPARSFASSPVGVALDGAYPRFTYSTGATRRTLYADGSGAIAQGAAAPTVEHGLGRRIEFPPGNVDLLVKLSSIVPNAPGLPADEQASHTADVTVRPLARYLYA